MSRNFLGTAVLSVSLALPVGAMAADYAITTFTVPGAASISVSDINDAGQITGTFYTSGAESIRQGFILSNGDLTIVAGPAGSRSVSLGGISNAGVAVGSYSQTTPFGNKNEGFIYSDGQYESFAVPGARATDLVGISPDGRYLTGAFYPEFSSTTNGFVYDRQTSAFHIVVQADAQNGSYVGGITNAGVGVGMEAFYDEALQQAFVFDATADQRVNYTVGNGDFVEFQDLNDAGFIVGARGPQGKPQAFVDSGDGFQLLQVGPMASLGQWSVAMGINNAGQIVGMYYNSDSGTAFLATPVPEAASWALMLGGLGLVAWRRRAAARRSGGLFA